MFLATASTRRAGAWCAPALALVLALAGVVSLPSSAFAWADLDQNKIDDMIDRVHTQGWNAAFVNQDPSKRMIIGVENPLDILFAIYVGYDHHPTAADQTTLLGTGVTMAWPFMNIDYIESHATYARIQQIVTLPGVTQVEAIPVEYATNHYGSRVVRARDSRGLAKAENYVLFPSVRQEVGIDGTGIVIGILDTGVNDDVDAVNPGYPGHESLKGKFLGGGEFWCGQAACSTPVDGSSNPQDHGGEASSYHATHVAGTAMGTGGPGGFFAGVAPGARLVDCKVLSDAGVSVGGANRGLDWCIGNRNRLWAGLEPGSIWQGIDVVSMSLGSTECKTGSGTSTGAGSTLINTAVDAGMVLCIATGNDAATECISSPAAADKSIAVGASEHARTLDRSDDKVTSFSNEGPRDDDGDADHWDEMKPSVVAPGAGIISAFGDPTTDGTAYQQLSGTSMATPHVSGCAALVLQANPSLTPLQVRTILQNTAEHNVPTVKATGDRGQDPYGLDANYDPSCGWGLVDVYAAVKEALNSTSGVQVVQIRAVARPQDGRIDVKWITQREYPFLGFNLYRAPDAGGAPGTFAQLNTLLIAPSPAGDPNIQGDDNRTPYLYADSDPALQLGRTYWYQVEWLDLLGGSHLEPPVPADYGQLARIATAFYSIVHNAVDNDLMVRVGADRGYTPGNLGGADFEVLGPGESKQDSSRVLLPTPPNTGTSTTGTIEHFWSVGFNAGDGAEPYLPPSMSNPWFLYVLDGGYVNRTGRVSSFSLFVNDSPGSPSGVTYVTDHQPMPQPTVEGGVVPVTLWIPEAGATATVVASLRADPDPAGCRLTLLLLRDEGGLSASVFRSVSDDFETREDLTPEPLAFAGPRFEYLDAAVEPGRTYYYWIQLHEPDGSSVWSGPVAASLTGKPTLTFALTAGPNPVSSRALFEYAIGSDVAARGPVAVSLTLHDLQGRLVRTLREGNEGVGQYRVEWNTTDEGGRPVGAGVYYMRFRAGEVQQSRKISVVR
ncbi:MAG: S8 family serine peptidase [Candidatus Eisenbacteria bacterium]|nr:S8 family serine peptidase [Candidatus Eisenbacteria bacterium]